MLQILGPHECLYAINPYTNVCVYLYVVFLCVYTGVYLFVFFSVSLCLPMWVFFV